MNDEKRAFVHGLWESVAANWIDRADYLEVRGAGISKAILDRAGLSVTDRVLALADGTGGLGMACAAVAGEVVSSDVVPAMVEAAARRSQERGLRNVTARVIDIEAIDAPDSSFDAVISREGLMFAIDRPRAFREVARVLRRGGRLSAAVWGTPDANPWLALVIDAVSEAVGHPVPPPGMPGPFALSDENEIGHFVAAAGLSNLTLDYVDVPFLAPSFDAWWDHTSALAGPVANILRGFDGATRDALVAVLRERLAPYLEADGSVTVPGQSLVISATKR